MKFILSGSRGYLGVRLLAQLRRNGCSVLPLSSVRAEGAALLDLADADEFDASVVSPGDVVLMAAAISAPDLCANEPERVRRVNVDGTGVFIAACLSRGARVIFFSSDTVYGEREFAFDEQADCNPAGEYAQMKHEVERRFLGDPGFKTIRLSYVFSRDDKFTKYLADCSSAGREADIFHPFCRAVIHRDDVVEGVISLAQQWGAFSQQVINFAGPDVLSRVEMAECLKSAALPDLVFQVTEPGAEFFTNRPRVIAMTSRVLPQLLGRPSRSLHEAAQIEFFPK